MKILNAIQTEKRDPTIASLYYNNVACIHFQMKKLKAASFYFAKAIKENENIYMQPVPTTSAPSNSKQQASQPAEKLERLVNLQVFHKDRRFDILYNNGLVHLMSGNPDIAFECFQGSSLAYYTDPRLWLRLAECCVASHSKIIEEKHQDRKLISSVHFKRGVLPSFDEGNFSFTFHLFPLLVTCKILL